MKFRFVEEHRSMYPVTVMCKVLDVSTSGYHAWRRRLPSRRAQAEQALLQEIKAIHARSRGTYGSPKIHAVLRRQGIRCSRKRVARLMRQHQIVAKRQRRYKRTTQRYPQRPAAPNRLAQQFSAMHPNQIWLADITYIATQEGWLYLAVVMDLYSRRIIGWSMAERIPDELTLDALHMAVQRRTPHTNDLLHHSDRGSQYTSGDYQRLLANHGIQVSMSGVGNCYDNAPMESFFAILKMDLVHHERFLTRRTARSALFDFIEVFYNQQRIHSGIGYVAPATYEQGEINCSS